MAPIDTLNNERYVIYYRVSTKKQGDSGLGLDAQKRDVEIYLNNFCHTCEVVAEFTDIESGKTDNRPELSKAIEVAKSLKATLLVSKLDRLSRKVSFIASLLEDKSLNFKVAVMPNADKFQLHIYAALAEQERDFISARTKAALAEAKTRGVKLGGLRDKTNERNKARERQAIENAQQYRSIIEPLRAKGASLQAISEALNKAGLTTSRGSQFKPMTVKRIIERLS